MTMEFRNWNQFFDWLSKTKFEPATIVDIGVATDTEELYYWYPNSQYIFVEPLKEFELSLQNLVRRYNGNYILAAAGSFNGNIEIQVSADLGGSSIFEHSQVDDEKIKEVLDSPPMIKRIVPVYTLDTIWEGFEGKGPALLKIDVQGGELEVLKGATNCIQNFEIIILLLLTLLVNRKRIVPDEASPEIMSPHTKAISIGTCTSIAFCIK